MRKGVPKPSEVLAVANELQTMIAKRVRAEGGNPAEHPEIHRIMFIRTFLMELRDDPPGIEDCRS